MPEILIKSGKNILTNNNYTATPNDTTQYYQHITPCYHISWLDAPKSRGLKNLNHDITQRLHDTTTEILPHYLYYLRLPTLLPRLAWSLHNNAGRPPILPAYYLTYITY